MGTVYRYYVCTKGKATWSGKTKEMSLDFDYGKVKYFNSMKRVMKYLSDMYDKGQEVIYENPYI